MRADSLSTEPDSLPFTVYIDEPERLWADSHRAETPTQLIVTPVELHQRNIERRLRETDRPKSNLDLQSIHGVAKAVIKGPTETLDRLDRLALLRTVLDGECAESVQRLAQVIGTPLSAHVEDVEQARVEVALVTGFTQTRLEAFADAVTNTDQHTRRDTDDLLAGLSKLQATLRDRLEQRSSNGTHPTRALSETDLLTRATRTLVDNPDRWATVYPDIETLAVAGASMLSAPLEDFCRLVATTTDVDVELHLRAATGPAIREQLCSHPTVDDPGTQEVYDGTAR
ncbi:hypothetical protein [Haloarcula laminariae]|uniref:hypothetical protein n=1 Tax=Haloarcula laminariae TaxID=2961577 RepID=UPI0024052918|nr:hypothetical protein [Halomicroarcula sp. FL173]